MTEKDAIEILKDMNDGYAFQDCRVCVSDNKFNEKKGICESKTCEYLNAIDTVIQALEQKDKELAEERIKYISSNLNNTIKQKQKEDEQLNALNEGWKIELESKNKEIEEKDKIIDLIYNTFYEFGCKFSGSFMKFLSKKGFNEDCEKCDYDTCDCKECIKQYLKKKAREENGI